MAARWRHWTWIVNQNPSNVYIHHFHSTINSLLTPHRIQLQRNAKKILKHPKSKNLKSFNTIIFDSLETERRIILIKLVRLHSPTIIANQNLHITVSSSPWEKGGFVAAHKSWKTMEGGKKGRSGERESIERERQLAAFSRDDAPNRRFGSLRRRRGRPASCISVLHYTYRGTTRIHTHHRV